MKMNRKKKRKKQVTEKREVGDVVKGTLKEDFFCFLSIYFGWSPDSRSKSVSNAVYK
jgi:hypothetical protein